MSGEKEPKIGEENPPKDLKLITEIEAENNSPDSWKIERYKYLIIQAVALLILFLFSPIAIVRDVYKDIFT